MCRFAQLKNPFVLLLFSRVLEGRRALFRSSSILSHTEGMGPTAFAHKRITESARLSGNGQEKCTSYFIEPVQWMEPALLGVMEGQVKWSMCFLVFGFLVWGFFFLQRQNCVSSPKGKPPHKVLGLPSLFDVNFAAYGQMLKCKILFHKEMS